MAETVLYKVADTLLTCLCQELAVNPNPPRYCCIRAGAEVTQDLGARVGDECCEGLGYVKVNSIFPSTNFPLPDDEAYDCVRAWAIELEMGVFRCAPQGGTGLVPCEAWTATAQQLMDDAQAM